MPRENAQANPPGEKKKKKETTTRRRARSGGGIGVLENKKKQKEKSTPEVDILWKLGSREVGMGSGNGKWRKKNEG